jgi:DNA-binding transcriptional regulator GbsR (MarR family)
VIVGGLLLNSRDIKHYVEGYSLLSAYVSQHEKERVEKECARLKAERDYIEKRRRIADESHRREAAEAEELIKNLNDEISEREQQLKEKEKYPFAREHEAVESVKLKFERDYIEKRRRIADESHRREVAEAEQLLINLNEEITERGWQYDLSAAFTRHLWS